MDADDVEWIAWTTPFNTALGAASTGRLGAAIRCGDAMVPAGLAELAWEGVVRTGRWAASCLLDRPNVARSW